MATGGGVWVRNATAVIDFGACGKLASLLVCNDSCFVVILFGEYSNVGECEFSRGGS